MISKSRCDNFEDDVRNGRCLAGEGNSTALRLGRGAASTCESMTLNGCGRWLCKHVGRHNTPELYASRSQHAKFCYVYFITFFLSKQKRISWKYQHRQTHGDRKQMSGCWGLSRRKGEGLRNGHGLCLLA